MVAIKLPRRVVSPDKHTSALFHGSLGVALHNGNTGKYKVYVDVVRGPEQGVVQLFQDETAIGAAIDLFAEKPATANGIYLGEVNAREGANDLMFKLVGKSPSAKGLGFDLVNIVCVRS
jgi:hypothetical protein